MQAIRELGIKPIFCATPLVPFYPKKKDSSVRSNCQSRSSRPSDLTRAKLIFMVFCGCCGERGFGYCSAPNLGPTRRRRYRRGRGSLADPERRTA